MDNKRISILDKLRPDLHQHFSVPKSESSKLKLNQNLACFLIFLLQILDDESPSFLNSQKVNRFYALLQKKLTCLPSFSNERRDGLYALLQKKLTFLHAFLGDTLFQCCEVEDTMNLLIEFETVANQTGTFIYSCVSAATGKKRKKNFDAGIHVLMEKVETFINEQIKAHCIKELPRSATSRSNHLSSLFIVRSLLEDLQDLMNGRFELDIDDIKDQFDTLIKELTLLHAFVKDVEKSQVIHTNHELQDSLIHIIDATYEGEYIINAHTTGHIPSWYLNLRIPFVVRKIQEISTRVRNLKKNNNDVKGEKVQALGYPEQDLSIVVGFEDIGEPILADLVRGSTKLKYISVFGMSGIGKSTMAKKLYNDQLVRDHFDLHVWCTVSKTYEKKKVFDEIWISLRKSGKDEMSNNESLDLWIYQTLIGRKYLIIMDDVWDSRMWDDLRRCFPDDGNGSRVLLTSQIKDIAPAGSIFHQLPLLTNSQCYELLAEKIFVKEPIPSQLLDTAQRIALKCQGLPLIAVVIAGILANVGRDESAWRNVEKNMDSYISDDSSMRILELSYEYLPSHLKPCLLSLAWSFVRKDIPVRDMIPLWISHGYVEKEENKSKDEIAEEYLLELMNRSLLIIKRRGSDGRIRSCEVHDLIWDMFHRRDKTEKFSCSAQLSSSFNYIEHHQISLPLEPTNICSISALPCRSVKTMISALGHSITQMPLLRVIKGQDSPIDEKRMGEVVHLRYFSCLARTKQVPEGICKLVNLEYLHLTNIGYEVDVPSTILKLVKLRDIRIYPQFKFLINCDISQIRNNVKSLSRVRIRNHDNEEILKCSPHLRKLKCICEGLFPDLSSNTLLESLNMRVYDSPRLNGELTKMNFPSTLKKVTLSGTKLPWEESLVVGKLPNLQVLKLFRDAFCGDEWKTREDEFKELRFLKMHNILSLRQWTSYSEHFPKLQRLLLDHVRVVIPPDFGNISTLQNIEVGVNCGNEVYISADMIREEQLEYENVDLKIITRGFDEKIISTPNSREEAKDVKGKTVMESSNVKETAAGRSPEPEASTPKGITCAGCNSGHGTFIICTGLYWHAECFCCDACKQPISDQSFTSNSNPRRPYHNSCRKDLKHPKCDVCKDYIQTDVEGNIKYQTSAFWNQKYCRSHKTDGTPRCCSCKRFESLDATYSTLDDGRALCFECSKSSIIRNTEECETLCKEIREFLEGLNIKVKQEFPVLLVNRQAMDEATKLDGLGSFLVYTKDTDGDGKTRVVINSMLVMDGNRRMVTGYAIVFRMMNAWMLLEGYNEDLNIKVKLGMCRVLTHMWLEHEIVSSSPEDGKLSEFEKKLGEYWKYCIENDTRSDYRDGFWEGKKAVDQIRRNRTFPN